VQGEGKKQELKGKRIKNGTARNKAKVKNATTPN
jgi:hypothetical protein